MEEGVEGVLGRTPHAARMVWVLPPPVLPPGVDTFLSVVSMPTSRAPRRSCVSCVVCVSWISCREWGRGPVGSGRPLEAAFWCVELHARGQKEAKQARPLGLPQPVLGREVHVPVPPQSCAGRSCRSPPFVFRLLSSCGLWRPSSAVLHISWSQFLFRLFFVILGVPLLFLGLTCPHNGVRACVRVCGCCACACSRYWSKDRKVVRSGCRSCESSWHCRSTENPNILDPT